MSGKRQAIIAEVMEQIETTITEQFERRVAALEAHIADLEERLNDRGIFSGDPDILPVTEVETAEEVQAAFDASVQEHRRIARA